MDQVPTTTNQAATTADSIISVVNTVVEQSVQKAIETYCPTLALPVIKQITEAIENDITSQITKYEQLGVTFLIIDGQVGAEKSSLSDQEAAVIAAKGTGNALLLQTMVAHLQAAQSALVHDDGSATPTGT